MSAVQAARLWVDDAARVLSVETGNLPLPERHLTQNASEAAVAAGIGTRWNFLGATSIVYRRWDAGWAVRPACPLPAVERRGAIS
jgi:hypothetical protein